MTHEIREGWPHPWACLCCRETKVCNVCGDDLDSGSCTNGRCSNCHAAVCIRRSDDPHIHGYGHPERYAARCRKAARRAANEPTWQDLRNEVDNLQARLAEAEAAARAAREERDREFERNPRITAAYQGMRKKLDTAFGASLNPDPEKRRAEGRSAGLDGAVDWACAQYAGALRDLIKRRNAIGEVISFLVEVFHMKGLGSGSVSDREAWSSFKAFDVCQNLKASIGQRDER